MSGYFPVEGVAVLIHADLDLCAEAFHTSRPVFQYQLCEKCGTCAEFCRQKCIRKTPDGGYAAVLTYCTGCGTCAKVCPAGCIEMVDINGLCVHC